MSRAKVDIVGRVGLLIAPSIYGRESNNEVDSFHLAHENQLHSTSIVEDYSCT